MNRIILIVLLLSIATSGAFCSVFNTKCKQTCKESYQSCILGFDSPNIIISLEICSEVLSTCLYSCIHPFVVDFPTKSPAVHK
ncbi:hypothetical protein DDB_G0275491 [Dictyostelium discoideum AX4]|uniref:Uncharacterized protein n=1 Tax=Dictyostelium discoideum TaxID=44689 RepID=Q86ID2_DICDI|nr:hypothetical protein DDB_G0275491 [Dictyostelium discoideum AX4]EAL69496.1 hypothetical protein DDB_G0275491 [Dictyostelium discoideum AX4]|eukprot:XP_643589.1 hypothetical protein DDB_G0275491 [Dictyostelium discoideum AX4]